MGTQGGSTLALILREEAQGPALAVELVSARDLADPRAELWFEAFLRRGHLDVPLEGVRAEPRPLHRRTEGGALECLGFLLAAETPSDARGEVRCVFPHTCLETVAVRGARRLVRAGVLAAGDAYVYELVAQRPVEPAPVEPAGPPFPGEPFRVLRTPLAPLRERAEPRHAERAVPDDYPVFFTAAALERAETAARRGAAASPPVETGGLLVGPLCSCPETGELFAVVVDVLEAVHAEGTTYTLTYSGRTWERIQAVMGRKRAHPATASQRVLGQVHGHSFLPLDGAEPCAECATREVCTRTTAFLSSEDLAWCRAVFRCEPWQLSQVFGLDALGRGVSAFYGQRGGQLVPRGYGVLERFEP